MKKNNDDKKEDKKTGDKKCTCTCTCHAAEGYPPEAKCHNIAEKGSNQCVYCLEHC